MDKSLKTKVAMDGHNYGEVWIALDEENDIYKKAQFALTGIENNFNIDYVAQVFDPPEEGDYHYVLHITTSNKGEVKWNEYFIDAVSIINRLKSKNEHNIIYIPQEDPEKNGLFKTIEVGDMFKSAWLIKWENNYIDDTSSLYIGVKY